MSAAKLVWLPTTRDIYELIVHLCGESGRNCQVRLGAPSSPGAVGPRMTILFARSCPIL
jgi:hypothetical protein